MDAVYQNSAYIHSTPESRGKRSQNMGKIDMHQNNTAYFCFCFISVLERSLQWKSSVLRGLLTVLNQNTKR